MHDYVSENQTNFVNQYINWIDNRRVEEYNGNFNIPDEIDANEIIFISD